MSVSDSLVFKPKPASIAGTTHRQTVPAYNGTTFGGQQTILINIPCGRRGHYLNTRMSYLRFSVKNKDTANTFQPDYTAASFIQSLSLYHGANLLEQIHEYNALFHLFMDLQGSFEELIGAGNILYGTSGTTKREGATLAAGSTTYFCIPLMSGIIGGLQSKHGSRLLWEIGNVELQLEFVEVTSEVDRMIQQANPRYVISYESFANYTNSIESAEGQINKLIPARFSSLKTLYTIFRKQADLTTAASKSVTSRPTCGLKNWYYSVSGENIPQTPVREDVESFAELQKALHVFGSADNNSIFTLANYTGAAGGSADNAFAIGQNLEVLSHKSTLTESGKNTLNTNCYLLGSVTTGSAAYQISTRMTVHRIFVSSEQRTSGHRGDFVVDTSKEFARFDSRRVMCAVEFCDVVRYTSEGDGYVANPANSSGLLLEAPDLRAANSYESWSGNSSCALTLLQNYATAGVYGLAHDVPYVRRKHIGVEVDFDFVKRLGSMRFRLRRCASEFGAVDDFSLVSESDDLEAWAFQLVFWEPCKCLLMQPFAYDFFRAWVSSE
eukprot:jgi/Tetstr1/446193/TSEL_003593.t1